MEGYNYLYTAGSTSQEVHRFFILPDDAKVKVRYFPEGERYSKQKITTLREARSLKLATIQTMDGQGVLPSKPEELLTTVISGQIFYPSGSVNSQIRRKGKIVAPITDEQLKQLLKMDRITIEELYTMLDLS